MTTATLEVARPWHPANLTDLSYDHPDGTRIAFGQGVVRGEIWRIENLLSQH